MHEPFRVTAPRRVQWKMAHALLPALPAAAAGSIALLPHQQHAVARLRRILDAHHGALLADDVGLGKTFVALAVAHGYPHVHVIAPAGLRDMWRNAIARAAPEGTHLHSLHAYSRTTPAPLAGDGRTLVIIDEAHHLRHAHTARYRAVAHAVAGCDLLLLSATPLHNRARDLQTLFALFRGERVDSLAPAQLAALIVRRTTASLRPTSHDPAAKPAPLVRQRPAVREHPPVQLPQDRETLTRILALPAPLPAHDGAVAGALIRLGLLRAWCSSDAALTHALRRRQLRGAALRDALHAGRHPTQQELRSWVVGDDDAQLAFPELLAEHAVESGPLLDILERHLDALASLVRHHARHGHTDAMRAETMRSLLERHPDTPIVAFSQFTQTIAALQRALADIAGVAVVTSRSGRIASGPIPRAEVLASFAPLAHGRPPPPPHRRIRLLLATDLIAEGVNLQDAGVVVHLDLPWTHAVRIQRVGRCARIGSLHAVVHVYRIASAPFAEQALRLEARLARKHALTRVMVGSTHDPHATRSAAERASAWHDRLQAWHHNGEGQTPKCADRQASPCAANPTPTDRHPARPTPRQIAVLRDASPGALVLLSGAMAPRLVAVRPRGARWRVQPDLGAVLPLMDAVDAAVQRQAVVHGDAAANAWRHSRGTIRRALRRWWHREEANAVAGRAWQSVTAGQRVALRTLQQVIRNLSTADRHLAQAEIDAARRCILARQGAGHEAGLGRWCAEAPVDAAPSAARRWLVAWRRDPILARSLDPTRDQASPGSGSGRARESVQAVLLLVPD